MQNVKTPTLQSGDFFFNLRKQSGESREFTIQLQFGLVGSLHSISYRFCTLKIWYQLPVSPRVSVLKIILSGFYKFYAWMFIKNLVMLNPPLLQCVQSNGKAAKVVL